MIIKCQRCSSMIDVSPQAPVCPNCGLLYTFNQSDTMHATQAANASQIQTQQSVQYCQKCGSANPVGTTKCPHCGHRKTRIDGKSVLLAILAVAVLCLIIALAFSLASLNEIKANLNNQTTQNYSSTSSAEKSSSSSSSSSADRSSTTNESPSNNGSNSNSNAGAQTATTNQQISVGQEVTTEDWSFVIPTIEWRDEVYTLSDNMFGQYLPDQDGTSFYFMELDYKNLSGSAYRFNDFIKVELKFNDKYTIPAQFYDPYSSVFSEYFSCQVMTMTPGYMVAVVSDDIRNNFTSCKIVLTMKTPKTSYEINL